MLTKAILMWKKTATELTSLSVDSCIVSNGVSSKDSEPQPETKGFAALCEFLELKHLTTTAYHQEKIDQADHYKNDIFAILRHFVAKNRSV